MAVIENIQTSIENILEEKKLTSSILFQNTIFICRNDGVVVYFHSDDDSLNKNSIGALVGGLWQAGSAVTEMFNKKNEGKTFRLSFDTSSSGIHILPFSINTDEFFLGLYFSEVVNPALVKNKMKMLTDKLINYFDNYKDVESSIDESNDLFKNITDDEINKLFSFAES